MTDLRNALDWWSEPEVRQFDSYPKCVSWVISHAGLRFEGLPLATHGGHVILTDHAKDPTRYRVYVAFGTHDERLLFRLLRWAVRFEDSPIYMLDHGKAWAAYDRTITKAAVVTRRDQPLGAAWRWKREVQLVEDEEAWSAAREEEDRQESLRRRGLA